MSEITKPIALDESLHTTEPTPRNLADVLSDELQNLATAISGGSDKVPKTDIATVEPTNTASRAYSVGELVYVNGNLYKVITAITIGATFTVGTNIQSANVSGTVKDALDKVNTVEILATTRDSYNGVWTLMRCGHTYTLSIYDTASQQIPAGKINCPFAVDSSWLPIYYALTMSVSQSGHIWNVGATPTGISGWMYTADASQRFATVTWLK